jgi:hypothetical protein
MFLPKRKIKDIKHFGDFSENITVENISRDRNMTLYSGFKCDL